MDGVVEPPGGLGQELSEVALDDRIESLRVVEVQLGQSAPVVGP